MEKQFGMILILIVGIGSAGCLSSVLGEPPATPVPTIITIIPTPESKTTVITPAGIALQPEDLPGDYNIRDRTVMIASDVSPDLRDIGWIQGYTVSYYWLNQDTDDRTGIRQSISIYPLARMKTIFEVEKENLLSGGNASFRIDEFPFPNTGDNSIAVRKTGTGADPGMTYTVIFTKKNVFEKITMGGTATDYETLKNVTAVAAAKIR
jgi:hypothetical protein